MSAIPDLANVLQWTVRAAMACVLLAASACPGSERADVDDATPGAVTIPLVERECDTAPSLSPGECEVSAATVVGVDRVVGIGSLLLRDPELHLRMTTR